MTQIVSQHSMFEDFSDEHKELIAGCASNARFNPGELLLAEGQPADKFYLIRYGKVAIEVYSPAQGRITIHTYDEGDIVGWSWIVSPYRCCHDARARSLTRALAFDGACLRNKAESDPAFGYAMLKKISPMIAQSLERVELQLLDVYGQAS